MRKINYVILLFSLILLIIFLPTPASLVTGEYGLEEVGIVYVDPQDPRKSQTIKDGLGTDDGSKGKPSADRPVPKEVKYHAGISKEAQDLNTEYWNITHYYVDLQLSKQPEGVRDAMALLLLAAPLVEVEKPTFERDVFTSSVITSQEFADNPDVVGLYSVADPLGVKTSWPVDGSFNQILGPHSITPSYYTDAQMFTPFLVDLGVTRGLGNKQRWFNGHPGDGANWHDSAQMSAIMLNRQYKHDLYKDQRQLGNKWYVAAYTGAHLNAGESIFTQTEAGGHRYMAGSHFSPRGMIYWLDAVTQPENIQIIETLIAKDKPTEVQSNAPSRRAMAEVAWNAIQYCNKTYPDWKDWLGPNPKEGSNWSNHILGATSLEDCITRVEYASANKIAHPIKVMIAYAIIEARYSGEY